jgi:zinc transport system substrate-binding protein
VVTTVYPISFVVDRVAGERVEADDLVPGGAEPHDVELSPGQVRTLAEADLVFFVGGGFQPAVEDAVEEIDGDAVDVLEAADVRDEGGVDPHVWLDPLRLARIAEAVTDRLVTEDPEGAGAYRANLDRLRRELFELDNELARGLHGCELGEFVTAHQAFGYLAARYDLTEISLSGLDPEAEVSPTRLAEVARMARDLDLSVIFYEELVSPATAETLAAEVGARAEVLSPLESAPEDGDYFTVMRRNLGALEEALACD